MTKTKQPLLGSHILVCVVSIRHVKDRFPFEKETPTNVTLLILQRIDFSSNGKNPLLPRHVPVHPIFIVLHVVHV